MVPDIPKYILWLYFAGWWYTLYLPTPLQNDGVKVSWDDEIPNWMEK